MYRERVFRVEGSVGQGPEMTKCLRHIQWAIEGGSLDVTLSAIFQLSSSF